MLNLKRLSVLLALAASVGVVGIAAVVVSEPASAAFDAPAGCEPVGIAAGAVSQSSDDDEELADPHNMEVCRTRITDYEERTWYECTRWNTLGRCVEYRQRTRIEIVRERVCEYLYHSHGDPW